MIDQNTAPYAATLLRIASGVLFLAHGLLKVFVFTIPGTVGFFESMGLPAVFAYATIAAEIGGGLLLIAGVYTRVVALALVPILLGATWAHSGNGWLFSNEGGGWEFPLFWATIQVAIAAVGPGAYAVKLPNLIRPTATA